MAEIKPFNGVLYNKDKISSFKDVVAPPYDVISDDMREELYNSSEYNVIRLILGKSLETDTPDNNKYKRAGRFFRNWNEEGVLSRDEQPAFYIYRQEYEFGGKKLSRIGFLGLMKIEDPGKDTILPHEHTLSKPKEDRMNLIKEVKANLSPIFTLFYDNSGNVNEILNKTASGQDALIDIDEGTQSHKLWRLTGAEDIEAIKRVISRGGVFIADGHHRYEVARQYKKLRQSENGYDGSADHVLVYFADMADTDNLTVMGTHRALKDIQGLDEDVIISRLGEYFDIIECPSLDVMSEKLENLIDEGNAFGFFGGSRYIVIKPKDKEALKSLIKEDRAEAWKDLDVSILHAAVMDTILGLENKEGNITYVRDAEDAVKLVNEGTHKAAFIMNPTKVSQMKAVAELGEMMPQKSTYFYPKLLTGLVINKFDEAKARSEV